MSQKKHPTTVWTSGCDDDYEKQTAAVHLRNKTDITRLGWDQSLNVPFAAITFKQCHRDDLWLYWTLLLLKTLAKQLSCERWLGSHKNVEDYRRLQSYAAQTQLPVDLCKESTTVEYFKFHLIYNKTLIWISSIINEILNKLLYLVCIRWSAHSYCLMHFLIEKQNVVLI